MNKKSQAESIVFFFVLAIAIFAVSIFILRITNAIISPFAAQIGNFSAPAGAAVEAVHTKFTTWWDYAIVFIFFMNMILLFISAFLIDIHPAFVVVYIITVILMFVFGNYALYMLDNIWNAIGTSVETAQTPIEQFLINNFTIIMLGVVILSGIIMYAKFKLFPRLGAGGGYY